MGGWPPNSGRDDVAYRYVPGKDELLALMTDRAVTSA